MNRFTLDFFREMFGIKGFLNTRSASEKSQRSPELQQYLIQAAKAKRERRCDRNLYLVVCGGIKAVSK